MMPTLLVSNPAKPKEKRARPAWAAEMRSFVRQRRRGCGASRAYTKVCHGTHQAVLAVNVPGRAPYAVFKDKFKHPSGKGNLAGAGLRAASRSACRPRPARDTTDPSAGAGGDDQERATGTTVGASGDARVADRAVPNGRHHHRRGRQHHRVSRLSPAPTGTRPRATTRPWRRGRAVWGQDSVPDAGRGGDDLGWAEFASEPPDGDFHGVGERVRVLVPGLSEQALGAHRSRRRRDQGFEDGELFV
jgi:hypothetical protein